MASGKQASGAKKGAPDPARLRAARLTAMQAKHQQLRRGGTPNRGGR